MHKKAPGQDNPEALSKSLAVTYFHMGTPTLSSALNGFTSEFEMGSGGSHSLLPPGKLAEFAVTKLNNKLTFGKLIKVYALNSAQQTA